MSNQKRFIINILLIVLIVVLVGTAGYFTFVKKSGPVIQEPFQGPEFVVRDYFSALQAGDYEKAMKYLTPELTKRITPRFEQFEKDRVDRIFSQLQFEFGNAKAVGQDFYEIPVALVSDKPTQYKEESIYYVVLSNEEYLISSFREYVNEEYRKRASAINETRVADLHVIRNALEIYFEDHGEYPASVGNTPDDRWISLGKVLTEAKDVLASMPQDGEQVGLGYSYDYILSQNGKDYVLRAIMEVSDSDSAKVYEDYENSPGVLHGVVFGIDCNKPAFCLAHN